MTKKLSLLFRAQIIADSNGGLDQNSLRYKRLLTIAHRELKEAVEQALDEFTEGLKQKLEQEK